MLIDEAQISVTSGNGGDGRASYFLNRGKPSGGDGGRGGAVYAEVDTQLTSLASYARLNHYEAKNGSIGESSTRTGKDAPDLTLKFPSGTQLIDLDTGEIIDLHDEKKSLLCKGGNGGWGNSRINKIQNGVFDQANKGKPGTKRQFKVVMRLIADCGLIGLPNAGKSSLLNVLTNAEAKVANYPFTTLEPNLGILNASRFTSGPSQKGIVLADIPGLIEGASSGKGLGVKFLKHIEKVHLLAHCISCETTDLRADYTRVRNELGQYNESLLQKKEIILLTKADVLYGNPEKMVQLIQEAKQMSIEVLPVSIIDESTTAIVGTRIMNEMRLIRESLSPTLPENTQA